MELNVNPAGAAASRDTRLLLAGIVAGSFLLAPSIAAAAPWDAAVTAVAATLQGTLGKTIAIVAVIALGLMAMAGKLEWMTAIKVVVGIVIMFSAGQIINWIAPNAGVASRVNVAGGGALDAQSQAQCASMLGVWVPESPELRLHDGTVVSPYRAAWCVDTNNGTDTRQAILACQSTAVTAANTVIDANLSNLNFYDTVLGQSCSGSESAGGASPAGGAVGSSPAPANQ